ncbi:MAG: radical SAM protein [Bacilli bacterium]|jgi:pyruvate-formate lyase-activating enzyme
MKATPMIRYYNNLLLTLSEIPGHPALLVHALTGCSFHCFHCFNYEELIKKNHERAYDIRDVIKYIVRQSDLFEYIIFSGGEFLNAPLENLIADLSAVKEVADKPIIIYTNGTNCAKMKALNDINLVAGFHIDMKLPYHLLSADDFDLAELTLGIKVSDCKLFKNLIKALDYVVQSDHGYSKVRSVKYPFLSESAFEENRLFIASLNEKYQKAVPYEVNDFIYEQV